MAAGGLIYSATVGVPLMKRCVLRHGAKVQSSTVLVHCLWLTAANGSYGGGLESSSVDSEDAVRTGPVICVVLVDALIEAWGSNFLLTRKQACDKQSDN